VSSPRAGFRTACAALSVIAASVALAVLPATRAAATSAAKCPLKPSSAAPRGEAWAFTVTSAPAGAHPGITSSYAHGRGTWTHGRGRGQICRADAVAGVPAHNVVLSVAGSARVSPHVTRLGKPGVEVQLKVSVSASGFASCVVGTRGTVAIFASYYSTHRDRLQFLFKAGCAAENATFLGSPLHALITRNGRQVNAP
jgi:hypothetical protein